MAVHSSKRLTCYIAAWIVFCAGCAAPRPKSARHTPIETAIAMYIEGDYERAERRLRQLSESPADDALRRSVYLYLGRTYMALERYAEAADAFATGVQMGGGVEFEAFLEEARARLGASPAVVRGVDRLTRSQLAALFTHYFGRMGDRIGPAGDDVPPEARAAVGAGVMKRLADHRFHGERYVSPASMYVIAHRVIRWLGREPGRVDARFFPEGFGGAVSGGRGRRDRGGPGVSGRFAVDLFEAIGARGAPVGGDG